jgi:uncharacterized protein (DUF2141 family)
MYFFHIILANFFYFMVQSTSIEVNITGFASDKGKAMLLLLDENEKEIEKLVLPVLNKKAIYKFNQLKPGKYAVKAFHDANSNQKLDTNFLGIPKEKWGVSNNVSANFGPPDFKKMLFEVVGSVKVQIKLH